MQKILLLKTFGLWYFDKSLSSLRKMVMKMWSIWKGLQGIFQCPKKMCLINAFWSFGQTVPYVLIVAIFHERNCEYNWKLFWISGNICLFDLRSIEIFSIKVFLTSFSYVLKKTGFYRFEMASFRTRFLDVV